MDIRDLLIDGIEQANQWLDDALKPLSVEQINHVPGGQCPSIGFSAWHVFRTQDNVVNFVLQRKPPAWLEQNLHERWGLPKVDQGTGMANEVSAALRFPDAAGLRDYGRAVNASVVAYVRGVPDEELAQVQVIKPLGEMSKAKVLRQVIMTHTFMHLGEVNAVRGMMGLPFSI